MKQLLLAAVIMGSFIAAGRANAQVSGNELQDKCKEEAKDGKKDFFSAGVCMGYITGVRDAQLMGNSFGARKTITSILR